MFADGEYVHAIRHVLSPSLKEATMQFHTGPDCLPQISARVDEDDFEYLNVYVQRLIMLVDDCAAFNVMG
jgi:hypothetical protein